MISCGHIKEDISWKRDIVSAVECQWEIQRSYMERKRTDEGLWTIVNSVMNMVHLHQIVQWRK